jgi:hypothetical protein
MDSSSNIVTIIVLTSWRRKWDSGRFRHLKFHPPYSYCFTRQLEPLPVLNSRKTYSKLCFWKINLAAVWKIDSLFSAQQHQLEGLSMEPASSRARVGLCVSLTAVPGLRFPSLAACSWMKGLGPLTLRFFTSPPPCTSSCFELYAGPSQQQTVPLNRICPEKPNTTSSWSW